MMTISLCMIVKKEQDTLEWCLQSVQDVVDEIIIVDTGSIDKTKEVYNKWNKYIFDFTWIHNLGAARNLTFSKANMT